MTHALLTKLSSSARAISGQAKLQVLQAKFGAKSLYFANDSSNIHIELPEILTAEHLAQIRGEVDRHALIAKYHNAVVFSQTNPSPKSSSELFALCELARIDAIGSLEYLGIRANIKQLRQANDSIAQEIYQLLIDAEHQLKLTDPLLLELLLTLPRYIYYQDDFAKVILEIIKLQGPPQTTKEPEYIPAKTAKNIVRVSSTTITPKLSKEQSNPSVSTEEIRFTPDTISAFEYSVYTKKFDRIIRPEDVTTPHELASLAKQLAAKADAICGVKKLAAQLKLKLMARKKTWFEHDMDDGMIDSRKLTSIIINPAYSLFYKQQKHREENNALVSLLIDNSGSMRGKPITISALCASLLAQTLSTANIKTEILGFTTREWKGGNAHNLWAQNGGAFNPGRLSDLLHIIYKSADMSYIKTKKNLGLMLKEGLLKENIDGEALLWACNRLKARAEQRQILIVISDGAPVDDSTSSANDLGILDLHLRQVINHIEHKTAIELIAIGIGHNVSNYYKRAVMINDVSDLGEVCFKQLLEVL
jgi:cobalamin biosynthesis protein CobT